MALMYEPAKEAIREWGPSLTEPEHASELTPQGIIRKLQSGIIPAPGSLLFGYEDTSMDYITRKQNVTLAKAKAEADFQKLRKELKDKKVKFEIPKTFEEFQEKQEEFQKFTNYALKHGFIEEEGQSSPGDSNLSAGKPVPPAPVPKKQEANADVNLKNTTQVVET